MTYLSQENITELRSLLTSNDLSRSDAQSIWSILVKDARENGQKAPIPPPDPPEMWCPHKPTPRQQIFLDLYECREVMYGGAAGGGKTDGLLMSAAQYLSWPGHSVLILRRTLTEAARSKSILDRAIEWWSGRYHYSASKKMFTFPSGATIEFGYLKSPRDQYLYQSSEYTQIIFDELTHFTEAQYLYLHSRLRERIDNPVPLQIRSGTNPGGEGHFWVKERFISEEAERDVLAGDYGEVYDGNWQEPMTGESVKFVPARIEDNQHIGPEYEQSLNALPEVEREQLKVGNWTIAAQGIFKQHWFRFYNQTFDTYVVLADALTPKGSIRIDSCMRQMMIDPGGTGQERSKEDKGKPPSFSAITICDVNLLEPYWMVIHAKRFRAEAPDLMATVKKLVEEWNPDIVGCENTGLGLPIFQLLARMYPHLMRAMEPGGKDKYTRSVQLQNRMEAGQVLFPNPNTHATSWYGPLVSEMLAWRATPDETADQIDTLSFQVIHAESHMSQMGGRLVRPSKIVGRPL